MLGEPTKPLRCAVYTRKSTAHGLDQEFNSLHAQRDACKAYITSQASLGWKLLPQHYDDPAYSGGNLNRPALKRLLDEIRCGKIDVVVVYKVDRLTRSLADFAKLLQTFDSKSVSFVAVTQQFNTTTSMGRLTLNMLLSFAQFERELASERVKDKVAAARKLGKWTGGTVPLGYDARNKKLVINASEAQTVRTIFQLYLELRSFGKLVAELDERQIITKRRNTKIAKYQGGIPFTYGPLAYFLKNRIYLGETHHGDSWFKGEHDAILDHGIFDRVQKLLRDNGARRGTKFSESGALLKGKLFDDKGNRMGPTFSSKNGVRYRFYASTALRGRKRMAGSVTRVSAPQVERLVTAAIKEQFQVPEHEVLQHIEQVIVSTDGLQLRLNEAKGKHRCIDIPLLSKSRCCTTGMLLAASDPRYDQALLWSIVRAHAWLNALSTGAQTSVESLAAAAFVHPKVVRQGLQLAFLTPELTRKALSGEPIVALNQMPKLLPLSWADQHRLLSTQ
jgi:site-specific DNA recombinase